jgi:hypothetical protein
VGIGHVLEHDASLWEALDLKPNWDAERTALGEPWVRKPIDE